MVKVEPIADLDLWDALVEQSPQGTIFSTSRWLKLLDAPYQVYGCYQGNNLMGGAAIFDNPQPLTPFQGILIAPIGSKYTTIMSRHNEVAKALMKKLPNEFCCHYEYPDVRPFLWAGWQAYIRYTYVLKPDWGNLEKDLRNEIRTGIGARRSYDIETFDTLYGETFARKELPRTATTDLILRLFKNIENELWMAEDNSAGALLIKDSKRWYYILGASMGGGSASVVWAAVMDKNEVDLVGCNAEKIGAFKRNFGGELKPYYGVKRNV